MLANDTRGPEGNRAPHPPVVVTDITLEVPDVSFSVRGPLGQPVLISLDQVERFAGLFEQLLAKLRTTQATRIRKL